MRHTLTALFTGAGLALASSLAVAVTGYVDTSVDKIVRSGDGDCVHTHRWSYQTAIAECDPEIVAARERAAAEVAAMEVTVRTELKPIHLEAKVLFGFDSDELTDAGKARLDDMLGSLTAATLKEEKIRITGYTDRIGPVDYNQRLSVRRAAAVRGYLVSKGLVPDYIEMRGLGPANPVVACDGLRGAGLIDCLAPNRRAEVEFSAMEEVRVEGSK